jgi:MFS family permease
MSTPPPPPSDNDPTRPPSMPGSTNTALRAILAGVSIDICGTTLLGLVIRTIYAAIVSTPEMTQAQIDEAVRSIPNQSPLMVLGNLLGSLISVAAGYVCARIARRDEYGTGALMAGLTTLVSLMLGGIGDGPVDLELLFILCGIACAMLGVMYGAQQNRRLAAPASPPVDTSAP